LAIGQSMQEPMAPSGEFASTWFFFSSRRRHTRWPRDWSSDVCSSDLLKPIFYRDERIAFAGTVCHQTDMGGRVAGSNASDSTETYQEGLRIPPVKMYDGGEPNETLFRLIEKNVRVPVRVFGDMRAQLSACHIAEAA